MFIPKIKAKLSFTNLYFSSHIFFWHMFELEWNLLWQETTKLANIRPLYWNRTPKNVTWSKTWHFHKKCRGLCWLLLILVCSFHSCVGGFRLILASCKNKDLWWRTVVILQVAGKLFELKFIKSLINCMSAVKQDCSKNMPIRNWMKDRNCQRNVQNYGNQEVHYN